MRDVELSVDGRTINIEVDESGRAEVPIHVFGKTRNPGEFVRLEDFPLFTKISRSREGVSKEDIELAIAGDPLSALALEGKKESLLKLGALRTPSPTGERVKVVGFVYDPASDVRPRTFVDPSDKRKRRGLEPVEYGWGRKPGEPCQQLADLPRWCLEQRSIVSPNLPDPWVEMSLLYYLASSNERLRLFGLGLTKEQIDEGESQLRHGNLIDWVKLQRFNQAIEANRSIPPSSEEIQKTATKLLCENKTWETSEITNSDDDLLATLFRGLRPSWPQVETHGRRVVRVHFPYERVSETTKAEGGYLLPDVEVVLNENLSKIELIRYRFDNSSPFTEVQADEKAGLWSEWGHAKRLVRLALFVQGQYESHLAAHILLEALQVAIARCGEKIAPPVREFLEPFVTGVAEINNYGNGIIVGESGIVCRGTGLSTNGSLAYASHALGLCDWYRFAPREATSIAEGDYMKNAQNYWWFVRAYVNRHMPSYAEYKSSYEALVNEVVQHSVGCTAPHREDYIESVRTEIPIKEHSERRRDGEKVFAISDINFGSDEADKRVAEFLSYFIFQASFLHTHANDSQRDFGGDLRLCPLGVRLPTAPTSEEEFWAHHAPHPQDAALQLFLVDVLSQVETPRIIRNSFFSLVFQDNLESFAREQRTLTDDPMFASIRRAPAV